MRSEGSDGLVVTALDGGIFSRRSQPGAIHKKANRFVLHEFKQIDPRVGIGDGQRCDLPDHLAPDAKALTTRSKNEYAGTGPEDRID